MPIESQFWNSLMAIVMFALYHHLRDIFSINMHDLDHELQNSTRSNVNMPIESQCRTFYLMAVVMFALVTIYEIFTVEICMTLTLHFRMRQGQMHIGYINRKPIFDFLCWQLVIFALSVTVCEIISLLISHNGIDLNL